MTAETLDAWLYARRETLEIENPGVVCGDRGFGSELTGAWSVEDGRLVFRADPDPLRGRGPDFHSCGESSPVVDFKRITVNSSVLTDEQVAALQATASAAPWPEPAHD